MHLRLEFALEKKEFFPEFAFNDSPVHPPHVYYCSFRVNGDMPSRNIEYMSRIYVGKPYSFSLSISAIHVNIIVFI